MSRIRSGSLNWPHEIRNPNRAPKRQAARRTLTSSNRLDQERDDDRHAHERRRRREARGRARGAAAEPVARGAAAGGLRAEADQRSADEEQPTYREIPADA